MQKRSTPSTGPTFTTGKAESVPVPHDYLNPGISKAATYLPIIASLVAAQVVVFLLARLENPVLLLLLSFLTLLVLAGTQYLLLAWFAHDNGAGRPLTPFQQIGLYLLGFVSAVGFFVVIRFLLDLFTATLSVAPGLNIPDLLSFALVCLLILLVIFPYFVWPYTAPANKPHKA